MCRNSIDSEVAIPSSDELDDVMARLGICVADCAIGISRPNIASHVDDAIAVMPDKCGAQTDVDDLADDFNLLGN